MPDPLIITEDLSAVLGTDEARDMLWKAGDKYKQTLKDNQFEAPAMH
jgi:hypothetical protein